MKDLREKILQEGKGHKPRLSPKVKTQKFLTIPHREHQCLNGVNCRLNWRRKSLIFLGSRSFQWQIKGRLKKKKQSWHGIFFSILLALCVVNPTVKVGYPSQSVSNTPVWMFFYVAWTSCESNSEVSKKVDTIWCSCNFTITSNLKNLIIYNIRNQISFFVAFCRSSCTEMVK